VTRPRLDLGTWPTPLRRARRLEARLGAGPLFIKRDDLSGFAVAGSKARPLEYLLAGALAENRDTLVVGGVATSNFCQGAAIAARAAGLACHVVLPGHPPPPAASNLAMAIAGGAQVSFSGGPREQLDERIQDRAVELSRSGRSVLAIPRGGANSIGTLGFASAARELAEQLAILGHDRARIVLAVGSGASIAGLLVGASRLAARWTITGVSVSRSLALLAPHLRTLVTSCAKELGVAPPEPGTLKLIQAPGGLRGAAGPPTPEERSAALLALETEGLVLDSHYTARAFPIALRQLEQDGPPVVFWHTGGLSGAISSYLIACAVGLTVGADPGTGTQATHGRP
jgi:1-aminocyclopropane-1-carboxylate deaminase/D-cysteine desulfhydrase-like pyridoxal-dependent ACC family enzyme